MIFLYGLLQLPLLLLLTLIPSHTEDVNIATNILNINEDQTLTEENSVSWDENRLNEVTNESNTQEYQELVDGMIPELCSTGLRICHININSVPPKMDELKLLLSNDPFDIVAISETHCDSTVTDTDILLDNYCLIRKDRSRHGGGVALYVNNSVSFESVSHPVNELEVIFIKIKLKRTNPLYLGVIYRPPNSSNDFFPDEHKKTGVVKTHISDHYLIFTVFGYTKVENKHVDNVIEYRCFNI